MPFILKKISQEDRRKYNFNEFINKWLIDKDREIFAIHTGGTGYGTNLISYYEIHLGDAQIIFIESQEDVIDQPFEIGKQTKHDVIFNISKLQIPKKFQDNLQKAKDLITELLNQRGFSWSRELTGNVVINFPDKSNFYFIEAGEVKSRKGE